MTTALRTYRALLAEGIPRADAERAITYAGADLDRALEWLRRNTRLSAPVLGTASGRPPRFLTEDNDMEPTEHILQFFAYAHLPLHLQAVSKPFGDLANAMVGGDAALPRNPERTVALRKLLEAKDAAVRALLAK